MKPQLRRISLMALCAVIFATAGWFAGKHSSGETTKTTRQPATAGAERKVLYWYDPMTPGTRFDKPGKSPFMDMDLVPRYADEEGQPDGVQVSARQQQNLGVRTADVTKRVMEARLDGYGTVAVNERTRVTVPALASGLVEKLYVNAPQQFVRKGEALAQLWIPQWAAAQQEYLAVRALGDAALNHAARERLALLFMPEEIIRQVERTGKPQTRVTVRASQAGYINQLEVREGAQVSATQALFDVAALNTVWAVLDYPQNQAAQVHTGSEVTATTQAWPGKVFQGKVTEVLPNLDADTRTLKARVTLDNPDQQLRPGMYLHMALTPATQQVPVLAIPEEALITTGSQNRVLLAEKDGYFSPQAVTLGEHAQGFVEVKSGLKEGQRIVVSGQFLIDSEASLRSALPEMADNNKPGHAATQTAATDKASAPAAISANGEVVALADGAVTISHAAIPALKWPPMTMDFSATPQQQQRLKIGDHVMFSFTMTEDGARLESIMNMPADGHKAQR